MEKLLDNLRPDYDCVAELVAPGSRVLDLGCGNGELLERLVKERGAIGSGVEINENNVIECIGRGLSVYQGNIDEGLRDYADNSYDFVILNQTLQVTHKPDYVLNEMLRVGACAVVSFPNFAYWRIRLNLFFGGAMPKTALLPFEWYNTPNIRLLTIGDFKRFCRDQRWPVLAEIFLVNSRKNTPLGRLWPNLFCEEAIFVLSKKR